MQFNMDAAVRAWSVNGFVILPAYVPAEVLGSAVADLPMLYPTADEYHDHVDPARNQRFDDEFGGIDDFPFASTALRGAARGSRTRDSTHRCRAPWPVGPAVTRAGG